MNEKMAFNAAMGRLLKAIPVVIKLATEQEKKNYTED